MCHGRAAAACFLCLSLSISESSLSLPLSLSQSPLTTFLHICSTKRTKWNAQKISWQDKAKPKIKRSQIGQQPPLPSPALPHPSLSLPHLNHDVVKPIESERSLWDDTSIWTYGHLDRRRCRRAVCGWQRAEVHLHIGTIEPGLLVPGSRERETLDSTRTPADNCVYDIAQNTRQDETKDRHSTEVKKWDLCGVSLRQRENVMRFYDFISDNRPWNLMDTTWGSLVCCSAPPLPNSHCHFNFFGLTNKFEFVFRAFSWIFVQFPCAWWAAAAAATVAAKRKLHTN